MVGHILTKCECGEGNCNICAGGLAICSTCGLYEGGLTTECCRDRRVAMPKSDDVYRGKIDYKTINGKAGWVQGTGRMPCWDNTIVWDEDLFEKCTEEVQEEDENHHGHLPKD